MQQEFGIALHVHHDILFEVCEGYTERWQFIETNKPQEEQAIRLELLQIIPDELLPEKLQTAIEAARPIWNELRSLDNKFIAKRESVEAKDDVKRESLFREYRATRVLLESEYNAKCKSLRKLLEVYIPQLEILHEELCKNCPWDGDTIFRRKR